MSALGGLRALEQGEGTKLEALFEAVYGTTWRTKTSVHRYLESPPWPATVSVVDVDGLIVGAQPSYDVPLWVAGARRVCTILVDVVTHPHYRRRGIFSRVVDHAAELSARRGASIALTTPNNASYPGFRKKPDWRLLTTLQCSVRLLNPLLILERRFRLPSWLSSIVKLPLPPGHSGAGRSFIGEWPAAGEMPPAAYLDDLWRRSSPKAGIMQVRDVAWARWRFAAPGREQYTFLTDLAQGGGLEGYVVTRLKDVGGVPVCFLVDVLSPEEAEGTRQRLLEATCGWARASGAAVAIAYTSPIAEWSKALAQAKFHRLPQALSRRPYHVCARIHSEAFDQEILADPAAWRLTLADSDLV